MKGGEVGDKAMNANYRVRKGTSHDIEALIALLKVLFSIEADFSFNETKQRRGLKMMLSYPACHCVMVAEVDGKVVGMCTAQLLVSTAEGGAAALIEDMVVEQTYRKQGIGKALLIAIEQWAVSRGAKRLELLADIENTPALDFYQKMNWKRTQLICLHKKNLR